MVTLLPRLLNYFVGAATSRDNIVLTADYRSENEMKAATRLASPRHDEASLCRLFNRLVMLGCSLHLVTSTEPGDFAHAAPAFVVLYRLKYRDQCNVGAACALARMITLSARA